MGINDIMGIGLSAIRAQQAALEVTSHNVANMDTAQYSRQAAVFTTSVPTKSGYGLFLGSGVSVGSVRSAEDRFINRSLLLGDMEYGYNAAEYDVLSQIEDIFNETGDNSGIADALESFWNSWSDLAGNSSGAAERAGVRGAAEVLISRLHSKYNSLQTLRENLDVQIQGEVDQVNQDLAAIAELNNRIAVVEAGGQSAADYRTQRSQALTDLAGLIDFSYFEDDDGAVNLSTADGLTLVESDNAASLTTRPNAANDGLLDVYFVSVSGRETNITDKIDGGSLGGQLKARDEEATSLMDQLDEFAYELVNQVNSVHSTGYTLNGTTGVNFFEPLAAVEGAAASIALSTDIQSDLNNIAAGLTAASGDNENANLLNDLGDADVLSGGTSTFAQYYAAIVSQVGTMANNAETQTAQSETVVSQLETYRESIAGVSLEEELTNLTKFQQSYQAAARILNAATDMADILNNLAQ